MGDEATGTAGGWLAGWLDPGSHSLALYTSISEPGMSLGSPPRI